MRERREGCLAGSRQPAQRPQSNSTLANITATGTALAATEPLIEVWTDSDGHTLVKIALDGGDVVHPVDPKDAGTWAPLLAACSERRVDIVRTAKRLRDALGMPARPLSATGSTAQLLDDVRGQLVRYVVLQAEHFYDAVALWTLHAHAVGAADTTPRLIFKSPEKESGKTRALEVLEVLVPAPLAVTFGLFARKS